MRAAAVRAGTAPRRIARRLRVDMPKPSSFLRTPPLAPDGRRPAQPRSLYRFARQRARARRTQRQTSPFPSGERSDSERSDESG